ncbi:hypothetical protein K2X14_11570 [Acetobacter sp. TBRC 12305]|uniref:Uncharacterized protein n=1 Tax=Acetobacter garciniae TaxID=2817435 RepID=A0A939HQ53_9PROT|nr:hypothetical protein [Acetobacter garciniae]MBO1325351.1 hypothetical protein [Acetobacter garciniae]MBX0345477.1 hypothetical protein [Acetobacter garciniae]
MALSPNSGRGGDTVTVICRMPSGLVLDLYEQDDLKARALSAMPIMGPPVPKATVRLRGARRDPRFHPKSNQMLGMGGRTEVDAAFWSAWKEQNANYAPLKSGLIFAAAKESDAVSMLAERGQERTGLEGLDPDALQGVTPASKDDD